MVMKLIYITGGPYDTLLEVIGVNGNGIESLMGTAYRIKDITPKKVKSILKVC